MIANVNMLYSMYIGTTKTIYDVPMEVAPLYTC